MIICNRFWYHRAMQKLGIVNPVGERPREPKNQVSSGSRGRSPHQLQSK